jgi:uncharacterized membrane protein (DUF485 family)
MSSAVPPRVTPLDREPSVAELVSMKVRFIAPMIVIYMISYIGLTVLAAFAKTFLGLRVIGSLNLGFLLIGANYVIAWVLALLYVRVANHRFDPMVERIAITRGTRELPS